MKSDKIKKLQRRVIELQRKMEDVGPVIFGTLAAKTQKSRHKDGSYKICPSLVACLDEKAKMTTEFFIEVAKLKLVIAFFRDDAFADDSARTNLQQAFDQFSPSTSIKVI